MENSKQKEEEFKGFLFKEETEINQLEFEEFLSGSENGLDIFTDTGEYLSKESKDIEKELNLDTVDEVHYINNLNAVKILFINGCQHLVMRV